MNKESLSKITGGIAALILVYVFWFSPIGNKFSGWKKFLIWCLCVGTASSIGWALGKEDPTSESTNGLPQ